MAFSAGGVSGMWRLVVRATLVVGGAALGVASHSLEAGEPPPPTWAEEFDVPGAPDPAKWDYETGFIRNDESQFYTRDRPENAVVEEGYLVITACKEDWDVDGQRAGYTSASVTTNGRQEFRYGRIEVRAKVPEGRGIWPAIWLLGTDVSEGWPACGEIDLMEYVGFDPDTLHFNIHTTAYNHTTKTNKGAAVTVPDAARDWHVYALEWHADRLEFFLDGTSVFRFENEGTGLAVWPFDKPHYLILNVAVGGTWGGREGIDDAIFPQRMLIDYVRYWQAEQ